MTAVKLLLGTMLVLSAAAFTVLQSVNWKVKNNYSVKCLAGLEGGFKGLKATIVFDEAHPERSSFSASIEAGSVDTGNKLGTEHVKEALEAEKFPLITFVSSSIKKTNKGTGNYEARGNLILKGVTKEIIIPFYFDSQKQSGTFPFIDKETFKGIFSIVPKDFHITKMGTPDNVTIELTIPVTR